MFSATARIKKGQVKSEAFPSILCERGEGEEDEHEGVKRNSQKREKREGGRCGSEPKSFVLIC